MFLVKSSQVQIRSSKVRSKPNRPEKVRFSAGEVSLLRIDDTQKVIELCIVGEICQHLLKLGTSFLQLTRLDQLLNPMQPYLFGFADLPGRKDSSQFKYQKQNDSNKAKTLMAPSSGIAKDHSTQLFSRVWTEFALRHAKVKT